MRKTTILGIVALLAVLAMPTALASEYYLASDNSSVANPGDCTTVSVWLNATQPVFVGLFNITYDQYCADITSFTWNTTCFVDAPTIVTVPGRLTCGYGNIGAVANSPCTPGLVHLGDFEICCNTTTPPCQTDLEFNTGTGVWDLVGAIPFTVNNGTFACGTPSVEVDLNVTDIDVNPGNTSTGDAIFVNQINQINATVYNAGPDDITGDFDVCFYNNSVKVGTETVNGLLAGANTTVYTYWTPSCDDYPGLSGDYLAVRVPTTLSVTVDCEDDITETDELNNTLSLNTEVSASGYKSKNFDCNPADPLTPFKYAGDLFTGGLAYNVSGTKQTLGLDPNQTRVHHIELPSDATVKDARLYITYYDDFGNPSPGFLANLSVNFTGPCGSDDFTTPDAMYTDSKAYGLSYNLPKGKYAYDVTSLVCNTPSNDYTVTVENIEPVNPTVLLGGILVVVYEGGDETIQLWWQEGCDLLSGRTKYASSTTGATATVALPGSINLATVDSTELITFVDQGMAPGSNMLFNGNVIKTDAWDVPTEAYPNSKINVENKSVSVLASGNNMGFQDTGTSGMQANLAFLVVKKMSEVVVEIDPCPVTIGSDPADRTTVNITLQGIADYGSGTIHLYYDPTVVEVDAIYKGDSDDFASNPMYPPLSPPYVGGGHVEISAFNTTGVSGDVAFVMVEFRPTGAPSDCTSLNLTIDTLYDRSYNDLQRIVNNCSSFCIVESTEPIVSPPIATPAVILNDTIPWRARVQQTAAPFCTNVTNLTVFITDATAVTEVYVNLTPILGAGHDTVRMNGPDGSAAGTWYKETNASYSSLASYSLNVMANDPCDNWNNGSSFTLTVDRRGDVRSPTLAADNKVSGKDYYYIARYTVDREPAPEDCTAQVQPAASWDEVDMADALFIAMYVVGNGPAP